MVKCGIIPLLVRCLSSTKKKLLAQIANTICSLAQNNVKIQTEFRKANVIPSLVSILLENLKSSSTKRKNKDQVTMNTLKALIALSRANSFVFLLLTLFSQY